MPRIQTYDAGNLAIQPSERGTDARLQEARRTAGFYNEAGELISGGARARASAAGDVDRSVANAAEATATFAKQQENYFGHKEVSKGAAAGAALNSDLNDKWDAAVKNADPNDPSVAAKFKEEVLEPSLQKFKESYSNTDLGQRWSEQHVESTRNHFFQKTAADMTTLAGAAVEKNVREYGNAQTNLARKSSDMHTVDFLLSKVDTDVAAIVSSSPNLKGAEVAKARIKLTEQMKEQIVKAGAFGSMEKSADPEAAAETFANRYPQYINGQEVQQFAKMAQYYKRVGESENRAALVQRNYQAKNEFNQKVNELEMSTAPQNAGDPPQLPKDYWEKLRDLSTHPGAALEPGRLKTMVTNGEAITARLDKPEPLTRVSHDTTMGLLKQMRATDDSRLTDNGAIYEAYGSGKLTRADFTFLNNEFNNLKTPDGAMLGKTRDEFFKRYAASIDGAMDFGGHSALGSQRMYQFEMDARRQEADLRKAGKDPHALYDPSSPDFIGKPVNLSKYHISLQEGMNYQKTTTGEKSAVTEKPNNEVIELPKGMGPAEAMKKYPSGQKIKLQDGRIGTVP